jgi:hypothetical protein
MKTKMRHDIEITSTDPVQMQVTEGEPHWVAMTIARCGNCGFTARIPSVFFNSVAAEGWPKWRLIMEERVSRSARYLPPCTGFPPTMEEYSTKFNVFMRAATTDGTWQPI